MNRSVRSGRKHEVHGARRSTVVKATVRLAAAWARGGADIGSGATAVDVVGKHGGFFLIVGDLLVHHGGGCRGGGGGGGWSFELFHNFL